MAPGFFHPVYLLRSPEGMKQLYTAFLEGFPDYHETIEDIIAEGEKVWHRFEITGTQTGEFYFSKMRLAPSNKKMTLRGVDFWRIVRGKVVEKESLRDHLGFYKQLGLIQYTEKAFID